MPYWDNNFFGIILESKKYMNYAKKVFDCWDIADYNEEHYVHEDEFAFGEEWDLFGSSLMLANESLGILHKLFGEVKVCDVEDIGNSIDWTERYHANMYDSKRKKWYYKSVEYSYGNDVVGELELNVHSHEVLKWEDIKDEIERRAESINRKHPEDEPVSISWIQGEHGIEPTPDNEPFKQICDEVFEEKFSYEEYGTTCDEGEIGEEEFEINEEQLESLLHIAADKGYFDLVDFITKRMNPEDISDSTSSEEAASTEERTDKMEQSADSIAVPTDLSDEKIIQKTDKLVGSIVITTGLTEEEEVLVKELVELNGGVFKDYFVKKIGYVVMDPKEGYYTKKMQKAKELIEQGKDVKILTLEEFKTLLK